MTADEARAWFDLVAQVASTAGPVGLVALWAIHTYLTARRAPPGPSPLENDVKALRADMKSIADDQHDIRDRVSRIEGRLEK